MKFHVDFFKLGGKWYSGEDLEWRSDLGSTPIDIFALSVKEEMGDRCKGMFMVTLHAPCGFPLMMFWNGTDTQLHQHVAVQAGLAFLRNEERELLDRVFSLTPRLRHRGVPDPEG